MTDGTTPQLYLVSPPRFEPAGFAVQAAAALDAGPVACLQVWMPDASDAELKAAVDTLRPVAQDREVAFVLNGRADLAAQWGCDGVHLDDPSPKGIKAARKVLDANAIVGVSCGASRHTAMEAAEAGADYVSFGPVFDTATKGLPADGAALETLSWWAETMEVPCVAVGGLTPDNIGDVRTSGCEFICVVSSVWNNPGGPAQAVAAFASALGR